MICSLFGHRDSPDAVKILLQRAVEDVLRREPDATFLVGNQGGFDRMAFLVLREEKKRFPAMRLRVVLAYLPAVSSAEKEYAEYSIFPDDLEKVPPRYAISRRNRWMVQRSDLVLCYVVNSWGGAAQAVKMAARQGKKVVYLAENR